MENLNYLIDKIGNIEKVTAKLGRESAKFAGWITAMMKEAGVTSILGGRLRLTRLTSSVSTTNILQLDDDENGAGNLLDDEIGTEGYYLHGDYGCWVQMPRRQEIVDFIDLLPSILEDLSKLGEEVPVPEITINGNDL